MTKPLSPLEVYILFHLRRVNTDYAKSISKVTKVPIDKVSETLERMERNGLLEIYHGSAVKNTVAKLKLSKEVRKHHTYYTLSRRGKEVWKEVRNDLGRAIDGYFGEGAWDLLLTLRRFEHEHALALASACGLSKDRVQELLERMTEEGVVVEVKPKVLKSKHRKGKPKRETRCLHKYYKLTRLGELLIRYSKE